MSNYSSVKATDFIKVIETLGFYFDRQKGSHAIYKNTEGKRVVVPIHSGKRYQIRYFIRNASRYRIRQRNIFKIIVKISDRIISPAFSKLQPTPQTIFSI